jgi:hypothetical protein
MVQKAGPEGVTPFPCVLGYREVVSYESRELEHLKIKTRLIDEMFASVMGEYVLLR